MLPQPIHRGDHRLEDVRVLGGRPDGHERLARLVVRHDAAWFDGVGHQPLIDHPLRDDDLSLGKRRIDGRIVHAGKIRGHAGATRDERHGKVVRKVGVENRRLAGHRLLQIDHGGEHLVFHDDGFGRVARDVAVAGDDHRDGFTGIADDVDGHGVVGRRRERCANGHRSQKPGDVGAGEHGLDAIHGGGRAGVNRQDPAVGDIASLEGHMPHPGDLQVVHVGRLPLDETRIFAPLDACPNQFRKYGRGHHRLLSPAAARSRVFAAAYWMALTIC